MKKLLLTFCLAMLSSLYLNAQSINFTSTLTEAEIGTTVTINYEYTISSAGNIYCAINLYDEFTWQSMVADGVLSPAPAGTNVTGSFQFTIPEGTTPTEDLTGTLNYKLVIELNDANWTWLAGDYPPTQINLTETLSNDSFENKPSFAIYPNPAADRIQLAGLENNVVSSVKIFNTFGKQVKSFSKMEEYFDVSTLSEGVYFVRIENGNAIQTLKFVKR